jgi:hypothetical protein
MMNLMFKNQWVTVKRWLSLACAGASLLILTGCQTMGGGVIPAAEFEKFTPKTADKRIMKEVNLRWEVREDVAQYCAKSIGMGREQAYITPPVACAVWHVATKECVIITGKQTSMSLWATRFATVLKATSTNESRAPMAPDRKALKLSARLFANPSPTSGRAAKGLAG